MATVSAVAGGITVSVAVFVSPAYVAVMLTVVETLMGVVVTVKLALVAPAATVTLDGTLTTVPLLLVSITIAPPLGAALLTVTVPCKDAPPVTLVGFNVSEESVVVDPAAPSFTIKASS